MESIGHRGHKGHGEIIMPSVPFVANHPYEDRTYV